MGRVRVHSFGVSLDGFGTGEGQSLEHPFGHAGTKLVEWSFNALGMADRHGDQPVIPGVVNDMVSRGFHGIGATVMGRNMFGPPGVWIDDSWTGWWGDAEVYGHPVFVMTHVKREPLKMPGGTTFHFVEDSPENVLSKAKAAAGDADVCIRGGVSTVRKFLRLGLVDEAHIVVVPVVLGRGERLWDGLEALTDHYDITEAIGVDAHAHLRLVRKVAP